MACQRELKITLLLWSVTILVHQGWWQNSVSVLKHSDLHPKDHNIQMFINAAKVGWGTHLQQDSVKSLWSDWEKKAKHKCSRTEASIPGPETVQGPVSESDRIVAGYSSTVVPCINKLGGTHSAEMCALLWRIMTWCSHCQKNKAKRCFGTLARAQSHHAETRVVH